MNSLITIIIPVYNVPKKYLDICIDSVINQTYKNIEILIIDDGSRKEIAETIDKYTSLNDNIKIFHKENEGVSKARNKGIELSKGEWILFVDADDYIEKDAVEKLINNSEDVEVVISRTQMNTQKEVQGYNKEILINNDNREELIKSILQIKNSKFNLVDGVWSKLYKKKFIIDNNIKFDEELSFGEDFIFNLKVYLKANKIMYIPNVLYYWRRDNENSVTQKYNKDLFEKQIKVVEYINQDFNEEIVEKYKQEYYNYLTQIMQEIVRMQIYHEEANLSQKEKIKQLKILANYEYFKICIKQIQIKKLHKDKIMFILIIRYKLYLLMNLYIFLKKQKTKYKS